jgi:LysR family transcriptional regulator, glycine cleavage system transcriptional activator
MKNLPLVALRALAAVHAHKGVRAAARELGVAHSSVSRHLAELEKWLGVAVVEPSNHARDFSLTPQGEALGEVALNTLRTIEQAAARVSEAKSVNAIIVSTTPSIAARWLLPKLAAMESQHHKHEISVLVEQQLSDLHAENIDIAIRMGRGPWPDLHCEPLMGDALYPVMSKTLFEKMRPTNLEMHLSGMRLLHDRDPNAAWALWREAFGPKQLDVKSGPRFASSDLVLRAAALSQGIALARHQLVAEDIANGALVKPFGELRVEVPNAYWIVMPKRSLRRPDITSFVARLKRQVSE